MLSRANTLFRRAAASALLPCLIWLAPLNAGAVPCTGNNEPAGCTPSAPAGRQQASVAGNDTETQQRPRGTSDSVTPAAHPPKLDILAVYSLKQFRGCREAYIRNPKSDLLAICASQAADKTPTLTGAGNIVVALDARKFDEGLAHVAAGATRHVFLNGYDVTKETHVTLEDRIEPYAFLRVHVEPGTNVRRLWAAIIRETDSRTEVPLHVGFGWNPAAPSGLTAYAPQGPLPTVSVSDSGKMTLSMTAVTLLIALALFFAMRTDVLRDKFPSELKMLAQEARVLRDRLRGLSVSERDKLLKDLWPTYQRNGKAFDQTCRDAADQAIRTPPSTGQAPGNDVLVGLAESNVTFSLTRMQLFAWFVFAICAGIYFWILSAQLPAIDGSILGLLGISVAAAGISFAVDAGERQQPNAGLTRGLLSDVLRGPGGHEEVHRFQAVVINLLLLLIGIVHVVRSITYPTFDDTWLIFLTISGATFGIGKQLSERK